MKFEEEAARYACVHDVERREGGSLRRLPQPLPPSSALSPSCFSSCPLTRSVGVVLGSQPHRSEGV